MAPNQAGRDTRDSRLLTSGGPGQVPSPGHLASELGWLADTFGVSAALQDRCRRLASTQKRTSKKRSKKLAEPGRQAAGAGLGGAEASCRRGTWGLPPGTAMGAATSRAQRRGLAGLLNAHWAGPRPGDCLCRSARPGRLRGLGVSFTAAVPPSRHGGAGGVRGQGPAKLTYAGQPVAQRPRRAGTQV